MGHQWANINLLDLLLVLFNLLITLLHYYSKLFLLLINHVSIKEQFGKHSKAKKFLVFAFELFFKCKLMTLDDMRCLH